MTDSDDDSFVVSIESDDDDAGDDAEEHEGAARQAKKLKVKENNKKSSSKFNANIKNAIKTKLAKLRVLFVLAEQEFNPVKLFKPDRGICKIFHEHFNADPMIRYDYLEVHNMIEGEGVLGRDDLTSWVGELNPQQLLKDGIHPFNCHQQIGSGKQSHMVASTNHVLGVLFKHHMNQSHPDNAVFVAFTKDSSLERAIHQCADHLAEFIGSNFDMVYLSSDAPSYTNPGGIPESLRAFVGAFYRFLAHDVCQKWWVATYPPLKVIHLLGNKALRDAAIVDYMLPQATFQIPLNDNNGSNASDDQSSTNQLTLMFNRARAEISNHPNTRSVRAGRDKYVTKDGMIAKPVEGGNGTGIFILTLDQSGEAVAVDICYGKPINSAALLQSLGMRRTYKFEPYIMSCREQETHVFVRRVQKKQWDCKYVVETNLAADGTIENSICNPFRIDPALVSFVKNVMIQLEDHTEMSWKLFASLIFRVDVFKLKWNPRRSHGNKSTDPKELLRVNGIKIFPLASTYASCGEKHDDIFECLNLAFVEFLQKTVNEATL